VTQSAAGVAAATLRRHAVQHKKRGFCETGIAAFATAMHGACRRTAKNARSLETHRFGPENGVFYISFSALRIA
jgi:hypothetical protein